MEVTVIDKIIGNYYHPTWREILMAAILVIIAVYTAVKNRSWNKVQKILFPVFTLYICFVLGITIFNRLPFDRVKYNFALFWSYKKAVRNRKLFWEIVFNYFMLLPFGVFGAFYLKSRWVVLFGLLFSSAIELTQFLMRRGLFEFDDIIGNTLGVLIGVGIYSLVKTLYCRANRRT